MRNNNIERLCDLWSALFSLSNNKNIQFKECNALVEALNVIEGYLANKIINEEPQLMKLLAVLTDYGDIQLHPALTARLKARDPIALSQWS